MTKLCQLSVESVAIAFPRVEIKRSCSGKGQETAALILQFAGNTPELVYVHTAMGVAYLAEWSAGRI